MFFFNDTATTEIYTLSLHSALPISATSNRFASRVCVPARAAWSASSRRPSRARLRVSRSRAFHSQRPGSSASRGPASSVRSEEQTSELQSRQYLVCRLLLDRKNVHI